MNHFVYILKSDKDNTNYIGYTTDVEKRLKEHNQNSNKYSSSKAPWKLVWHCAFLDKEKAMNLKNI
jgi:putative endonuclease